MDWTFLFVALLASILGHHSLPILGHSERVQDGGRDFFYSDLKRDSNSECSLLCFKKGREPCLDLIIEEKCLVLDKYGCKCAGCLPSSTKCIDSEKYSDSPPSENPRPLSQDQFVDYIATRNQAVKSAQGIPDGIKKDVGDPSKPVESNDTKTNQPPKKPQHQTAPNGDSTGGNKAFLIICAGLATCGFVGLVVAGVCWYKLQKSGKASSEVDYPAYGPTGPSKERMGSPGDRKLAQSVQMYHYQHQKQQMIALEKANGEMKHDASDEDSEEENEEGDYTVYECPGLAPTGEMEVKNPLFSEDAHGSPNNGDKNDEPGTG